MLTPTLLALLACDTVSTELDYSETTDPTIARDTAGGPYVDPNATVTVTSPVTAQGFYTQEIEAAGGITVTWEAADFTPSTGDDHAGAGQFALYYDSEQLTLTTDTTFTIDPSDVGTGDHLITVVLTDTQGNLTWESDSVELSIIDPGITFVSPTDGTTVRSTSVVTVAADHFTLSEDVEGAPVFGEGHVHLYVDGEYAALSTDGTFTLDPPLAAGNHDLVAELVNNDHTSLPVPITASVTCVVPTVAVEAGWGGGVLDSASVPVHVTPTDFTFVALDDEHAADPGYGHYHVYVDGTYNGYYTEADGWALHAPAGAHEFTVALANSDHTEVGVTASFAATVSDDRPDIVVAWPEEVLTGTDTTFGVAVENFTLDPDLGGVNVEDHGHYHVLIDGVYVTAAADAAWTLPAADLAAYDDGAAHNVTFTLQNNDHTDLSPVVFDAGAFTVAAPEQQDSGG